MPNILKSLQDLGVTDANQATQVEGAITVLKGLVVADASKAATVADLLGIELKKAEDPPKGDELAQLKARIEKLEKAENPTPEQKETVQLLKAMETRLENEKKEREATAARILKMEQDQRHKDLVAEAGELKAVQGTPEEIANTVLAPLDKLTEQERAPVVKALKTLNQQVLEGAILKSVGGGAGTAPAPGSALEALEQKAQEIVKAEAGKVTKAEAFAKAAEQNPDLYEQYVKERG